MKRRQFLATTVGAASAFLARKVTAQERPCPPPSLQVAGGSSVNTACAVSGEAPDWVLNAISKGWAVGTWLHVSGSSPTSGYGLTATNRMRDVKTVNPSDSDFYGILDAWCGGTFAPDVGTHGAMLVGMAGGHGSYNDDNDCFAFDVASRQWIQFVPSTASVGGNSATEQYGEYSDGSPINNHTAHWPFYDTLRGEYVIPKGWNSSGSGSDSSSVHYGHAINVAAARAGYSPSQWKRLDLSNLLSVDGWAVREQSGGVWDPQRGKYWFWAMSSAVSGDAIFGSYDSASRTFTSHSARWPNHAWIPGASGINAGYAIDPIRNVIVVADYRGSNRYALLFNPNNPTAYESSSYPAWRAAQYGTQPAQQAGMGLDWSPALGGLLAWGPGQGATVYKAMPSTTDGAAVRLNQGAATNYALTWSNMTTGSSVSPVPHKVNNGVFNRFRVASFGSTDIAFAVTNVDGAVSAYRIT